MTYRDDLEAAHHRIDALTREVEELRGARPTPSGADEIAALRERVRRQDEALAALRTTNHSLAQSERRLREELLAATIEPPRITASVFGQGAWMGCLRLATEMIAALRGLEEDAEAGFKRIADLLNPRFRPAQTLEREPATRVFQSRAELHEAIDVAARSTWRELARGKAEEGFAFYLLCLLLCRASGKRAYLGALRLYVVPNAADARRRTARTVTTSHLEYEYVDDRPACDSPYDLLSIIARYEHHAVRAEGEKDGEPVPDDEARATAQQMLAEWYKNP